VVVEQVDGAVLEAEKVSLRKELAQHNEAVKELKAALAEAKNEQVAAMATIFSTTANFFRGDGKSPGTRSLPSRRRKTPGRISVAWSSLGPAARQWLHGVIASPSY
jgi:hypothetical protein